MENNYSEKRAALTALYQKAKEVHGDIIEGSVLLAFHPSLEITLKTYEEADYTGVLALLGMLYRNPPTFSDVLDRVGVYTEENSGLTPEVCELASVLLDRPVTWNDSMVLQRIVAGDNAIELSPEAFDRLTDLINSPREPNQALIDLMKRRTNFKDRKDDGQSN